MPTLLQINVTANWGSTGKIAEQIGVVVQKHGWDSFIAYGRNMNPSNNKLIKIGSMVDVYEHFIENRSLDKEGLASRRSTNSLLKIIAQIKPDVVHLHNIHDHYLNYRKLFEYLNQTDIKVVWTFHDCWAFTGHCYHFVSVNCNKWQTECNKCPTRNKFIDRSRENFLLKKSLFSANKNLTIVSCSEWMNELVKMSFLKEKRTLVIHNGVDLNIFKPTSISKQNEGKEPCMSLNDKALQRKFKIIAVSNIWLPYKGLNDIFKLQEMLPDNYEFIIVGLKAKQVKNLPSGIRGIQRTTNVQELVGLYNEADVLINPTYSDTFPTVNLEALACGTPVITYQTGGSPEAIDAKTGVVVEQGNLKKLAETIVNIINKPLKSWECRKRAEDHFDKDKCFEKYIDLYESIIERD